jgi:predicted alpha/beta superfamily hydrolase
VAIGHLRLMDSTGSALALSLQEAVFDRLEGIERFDIRQGGRDWSAAAGLPRSYLKSRRRYPLLLLLNASGLFGSAIEMSRALAASGEVRQCIVVDLADPPLHDPALLSSVVRQCIERFRVEAAEVAVFAYDRAAQPLLGIYQEGIAGVSRWILGTTNAAGAVRHLPTQVQPASLAWTVCTLPTGSADEHAHVKWKLVPELSGEGLAVPALIHGLRAFWGRNHRYGDEVLALGKPLVSACLRALAPVLGAFAPRPAGTATPPGQRHVVRSSVMGRDFEIFVSLPARSGNSGRRYPTLFALDANAGFATVAETAARLSARGEIGQIAVVGIGTPRTQGDIEFGYRRFEEFSPPADASYRFDDELGRFFSSLFAIRGQDARTQMGQAPGLWRFIVDELLPGLLQQYPMDSGDLTLLGHSAAGTFVGYALAQSDSPFHGYICLSPGVGICGEWMLREAERWQRTTKAPARVYAAVGSEEMSNRFNGIAGIPLTQAYFTLLQERGRGCGEYHELQGETHITVYPRALVQALKVLFGAGWDERMAFR